MVIKRTNAHNFVQNKHSHTRTHAYTHTQPLHTYKHHSAAFRSRKLTIKSHRKMKRLVQQKPSKAKRKLFPIKRLNNWLHPKKSQQNVVQSAKRSQRKKSQRKLSQRRLSHPLMSRITFKWILSMKMIWSHRQNHRHVVDQRKTNHHPNRKRLRYKLYVQQSKWHFFKAFRQFILSKYASLDLWPLTNTIKHTPTLDTDKTNSLTHSNLQI